MAKQVRQATQQREPSKEVWPLLDAFNALTEVQMPEILQEFLELVEQEAEQRREQQLERAAIADRIRAVASRRK